MQLSLSKNPAAEAGFLVYLTGGAGKTKKEEVPSTFGLPTFSDSWQQT